MIIQKIRGTKKLIINVIGWSPFEWIILKIKTKLDQVETFVIFFEKFRKYMTDLFSYFQTKYTWIKVFTSRERGEKREKERERSIGRTNNYRVTQQLSGDPLILKEGHGSLVGLGRKASVRSYRLSRSDRRQIGYNVRQCQTTSDNVRQC